MKKGEIYYCSDQFGPRFIKIIKIEDVQNKNDDWVFFWSSPWLGNIIFECESGGCARQQMKKWLFEKLLKLSFGSRFKGCIKVPNEVIEAVKSNTKINLNSVYMQYAPFNGIFSNDRIMCKVISKEEYRNLTIDSIVD